MIYEEQQNDKREVNRQSQEEKKSIESYFSQFYVNRKLPREYYTCSNQLLREDHIFNHILEETARETLRITLELQHKDHKEINKQFQATLMNYYLESYISPLLISYMGLVYKREVFREMKQLAEYNMRDKQKKYVVLMNLYCQKIIESGQQEEYVNILFEAILKPCPSDSTSQLEYCTYYRQRLCALILLQHYYTKKRDSRYQNFYCFWHELFENNFPILQYIMDDKQLRKRLRMNTGIRVQAVPSLRNYVYKKISNQNDKSTDSSPKSDIETNNPDIENQDINLNKENESEEKMFKKVMDNQKEAQKIEFQQNDKKQIIQKKQSKLHQKNQEKNRSLLVTRDNINNNNNNNNTNRNTGQKNKGSPGQNELNKTRVNQQTDQKQEQRLQSEQQGNLNLEQQVINIIQNKYLEQLQKVEQLQLLMQQHSSTNFNNSEKEKIGDYLTNIKWGQLNLSEKQLQDEQSLEFQQAANTSNKRTSEKELLSNKLVKQLKSRSSLESVKKNDYAMIEQDDDEDKYSANLKHLNQALSTSSTSQIISNAIINQLNPQQTESNSKGGNSIASYDKYDKDSTKQEEHTTVDKSITDNDEIFPPKFEGENKINSRSSRSDKSNKHFKEALSRSQKLADPNSKMDGKSVKLNNHQDDMVTTNSTRSSQRIIERQEQFMMNSLQRASSEQNVNTNLTLKRKETGLTKENELTTLNTSPNNFKQAFTFSDNAIQDQDQNGEDDNQSEMLTNLLKNTTILNQNSNKDKQNIQNQFNLQMNLLPTLFYATQQIPTQKVNNIIISPPQQLLQQNRNDQMSEINNKFSLNTCKTQSKQSANSSNSNISYSAEEIDPIRHAWQHEQQRQKKIGQLIKSQNNDHHDNLVSFRKYSNNEYDATNKYAMHNNITPQDESNKSAFDGANFFSQQNGQNYTLKQSYDNSNVNRDKRQDYSFLKNFIEKQSDSNKGRNSQKNNRVCFIRYLLPYERAYIAEPNRIVIIQTIKQESNKRLD